MKTGEGKTLVATLAAYLNALKEKGCTLLLLMTTLPKEMHGWGKYTNFGHESRCYCPRPGPCRKEEAYAADITYGTNNEFGFDYLRDNMAISKDQLVQRDLHYAIVDEVDSILIDEARTPLIISGQADKPTELYYTVAKIIPALNVMFITT